MPLLTELKTPGDVLKAILKRKAEGKTGPIPIVVNPVAATKPELDADTIRRKWQRHAQ